MPRRRRRRRRSRVVRRPPLEIAQILAWADEEHGRTGRWPRTTDGPVRADLNEKWRNIDQALREGVRGLPGGDSLAKLLARERGTRNPYTLPPLTEDRILAWADAWCTRTGNWPHTDSAEEVPEAPGEVWKNIDQSLREGLRGLAGGDSLAKLLARERGVRNISDLPPLNEQKILSWAREHIRRTGTWPTSLLLTIEAAPGESWRAVDSALREGGRGMPGGDSLGMLLARHLGIRNKANVPPLTIKQILAWARSHRRRTGSWPTKTSGPIHEAPDETWLRVDAALRDGLRGLRTGLTLCRLLANGAEVRGVDQTRRLTLGQILSWGKAHRRRAGRWPTTRSGAVEGTDGETWAGLDRALRMGGRGLPGGDSLSRLFRRHADPSDFEYPRTGGGRRQKLPSRTS